LITPGKAGTLKERKAPPTKLKIRKRSRQKNVEEKSMAGKKSHLNSESPLAQVQKTKDQREISPNISNGKGTSCEWGEPEIEGKRKSHQKTRLEKNIPYCEKGNTRKNDPNKKSILWRLRKG